MKSKEKKAFFGIALIIVVVLDFYAPHGAETAHFWWQFPGFDDLYGFIGCFILMLFAKKVLYALFSRKEDYYER